jgi:hypothetical protein
MEIEQNSSRAAEGWTTEESGPFRWYHKAGALLYIFFCFEIGVFLLLYPWSPWWGSSFFSGVTPAWYELWNSPYLRGAVSGLGVIDIGISFSELFRLRRFARGEVRTESDGDEKR